MSIFSALVKKSLGITESGRELWDDSGISVSNNLLENLISSQGQLWQKVVGATLGLALENDKFPTHSRTIKWSTFVLDWWELLRMETIYLNWTPAKSNLQLRPGFDVFHSPQESPNSLYSKHSPSLGDVTIHLGSKKNTQPCFMWFFFITFYKFEYKSKGTIF